MRRFLAQIAVASVFSCASGALAASTATVGFDNGDPSGFTGNAVFEATGGNPGGAARHITDLFFNDLRTGGDGEPANPAFLGDYSSFPSVTFSFDVKTNMLDNFAGNPISRSIGIRLIDRDIPAPSGDAGVFFETGIIGVNFNPDWTTMSVTIDDPTSTVLPAGWIGFGDEDPNTFEPILPAGTTFADILAGVDEFAITGAVPGFFFTNAFWDVQIDNVSVVVPEPASCLLLTAGAFALRRRRA